MKLTSAMVKAKAKELGIDCAASLISWPAYVAELVDANALKVNKGTAKYTFQDPAALTRGTEDTTSARKGGFRSVCDRYAAATCPWI